MLDRCLATQASYDVVVVGGGIVGLGTARELIIRHPTLKFAVVEKENELCEYKDSHLLLLGLFLHEGSVAYSLKFGCNDTLKGNSSNNNHNHNHNRNNINKTLNRVKRTTIQLHAHVILSVNANPTNWSNEPLAESFNARAQGFF